MGGFEAVIAQVYAILGKNMMESRKDFPMPSSGGGFGIGLQRSNTGAVHRGEFGPDSLPTRTFGLGVSHGF
jgi:hypothetical protein